MSFNRLEFLEGLYRCQKNITGVARIPFRFRYRSRPRKRSRPAFFEAESCCRNTRSSNL